MPRPFSPSSLLQEGDACVAPTTVTQTFPSLALARLEAALDLIDDVDTSLAADQAVTAVPAAQRFQGIADFHGCSL